MEKKLLTWFAKNARILPWRRDPSPYHVWLSEIMLQQTRVEAVKEYYLRFLSVLPDIPSLAAAEEDTFLKLWEGLGYYSRVRNLHRAALVVMEEHGGQLPAAYEDLLALPGIGPYTAAAVASFCYGEKRPALDGNLLRIFARVTGYGEDILKGPAKRAAEAFFGGLMEALPEDLSSFSPEGEARQEIFRKATPAGAFNQALMDLGALICVPNGTPRCGECPWQEDCRARKEGRERELPVRLAKTKKKTEKKTVFLIHYRGAVVLRKRPATGLLAGLYEFPNAEGHLSRREVADFLKEMGIAAVRMKALPPGKHIFTHRIWDMTGYEVYADEWPAFGEQRPKLFLAEKEELVTRWSLPGAFALYRDHLLNE